MKTPFIQINGTIFDSTGAELGTCANPEIAALIVERCNTWQAQYAAGHAAATQTVNAQRDREIETIRTQAEQRGYWRAQQEQQVWNDVDTRFTLVA